MNILEKYQSLRSQIADGDLILFRGSGIIARIIQNCDYAHWNHIGIVVEKHGALFIVDANADGVQADRLSHRIKRYNKGDGNFLIIKPLSVPLKKSIDMRNLLRRSDDKWIKYDFYNGAKELLNRKFGWWLDIKLRDDQAICSSNVAQYAIDQDIVTDDFKDLKIALPQDYMRYLNRETAKIIC